MKKFTSVLMIAVLMVTFLAGCGKNRKLYAKTNFEDYLDVGTYMGIEIDAESEQYKKNYAYSLYADIYNYEISNEDILANLAFDSSNDLSVEYGDIVNIDYVGYIDENAFDGGSAQGYPLVIGSGTFIDDFEDELVGVKSGETVDVTATFPKNYSNTELAGVDAVFKVTVNSISKTPEEIYKLLGAESADEYADYLNKSAQRITMLDIVCDNFKIKDYPTKEAEKIYNGATEVYAKQGFDLAAQDKNTILKELVYPMMDVNMIMYYILDAEELEIYESTLESQDIDNAVIAESYAVQDIVIEYLLENADIK